MWYACVCVCVCAFMCARDRASDHWTLKLFISVQAAEAILCTCAFVEYTKAWYMHGGCNALFKSLKIN